MKMKLCVAITVALSLGGSAYAQKRTEVTKLTLPPIIQSLEIVAVRTKTGLLSGPDVRLRPTVTGGLEATGKVTLVAAQSSDVNITLSTSNTGIATAPAGIRIQAGSTSETFPILSKPVAVETQVTITASRAVPGDSKATELRVIPTSLMRVHLDSTSTLGGTPVPAHATFTGPPPASPAVVVSLTSSDTTGATVPGSVALAQGRTVADFTVQTKGQADPKSVTISGSYGGQTHSASLKIEETRLLRIGTLNAAGTSTSFAYMAPPPVVTQVHLTGVAPQGGAAVALTTNDAVKFPVPPSVVIPAGQVHGSVSINFPVNVTTGAAAITASYKGLSSTLNFTLVPPDIKVNGVEFRDRFSNLITRPPDSQPFTMCAKVYRSASLGNPNTTLLITYKTLTGGPSSTGRTFELPAVFQWNDKLVCTELPGLEVGQSHEVTLKADSKNVVEESNENNNTFQAAIAR